MLIDNFAVSSAKGPDAPYAEEVNTPYYTSPQPVTAPQPMDEGPTKYYIDGNQATPFKSFYERLVGGSLWHWQGIVLRMLPNDFKLRSEYHLDAARDWPISYADLAPYYRRAEFEMGVSANDIAERATDDYFGVRIQDGTRGYAKQLRRGIPQSYLDDYISGKLKDEEFLEELPDGRKIKIPLRVTPVSQARNAKPFDGRPACDGQGSCIPLCPTRAKYGALCNVSKAIRAGAELRANAVVTKLLFGDGGKVVDISYL